MKKILLSAVVLTAFSVSVILFQISCKKTAGAQSPSFVLQAATTTKLGGVIPDGITISVDGNGKISTIGNNIQQQNKILYIQYGGNIAGTNTAILNIYTANYDGSNPQKINLSLPGTVALNDNTLSLSPDHKTIFFSVTVLGTNEIDIYACNFDGSSPHKVAASAEIPVAY